MHGVIEIFMGLAALNLMRMIMSEVVLINLMLGGRGHMVIVSFRQDLTDTSELILSLIPRV